MQTIDAPDWPGWPPTIPSIPGVPTIPSIPNLPSLPGPGDMVNSLFGGLKNLILEAYKAMTGELQNFLGDPPAYSNSAGLPGLYGSGTSLASYLAYMLLIMSIMLAAVFFSGKHLKDAFVVWIIVLIMAPLWVQFVDMLRSWGNTLAGAVDFYTPPEGKEALSLPEAPSLGLAIPLIAFCLFFGGMLAAWIATYDVIVMVAKFSGLIAYSVSSLGKRMKQMTNLIFAFGLVATVFGKAFAVLVLDIGQVMVWTFPLGKTAIGAGVYTMASYIFAMIVQITLVFACYKAIVEVEGRLRTMVKGTTTSAIREVIKVDVTRIRKSQEVQPMPVVVVNQNPGPTRTEKVKKAGRYGTKAASSAALLAGHPELATKINRFGKVFK